MSDLLRSDIPKKLHVPRTDSEKIHTEPHRQIFGRGNPNERGSEPPEGSVASGAIVELRQPQVEKMKKEKHAKTPRFGCDHVARGNSGAKAPLLPRAPGEGVGLKPSAAARPSSVHGPVREGAQQLGAGLGRPSSRRIAPGLCNQSRSISYTKGSSRNACFSKQSYDPLQKVNSQPESTPPTLESC